ncbi:hypothetical protein [Parasphingorhabdus pacifica]
MIYILAAIGALSVAVLMWRAFGPERTAGEDNGGQRKKMVAPDDDPEFLRKIAEQQRKDRNKGEES